MGASHCIFNSHFVLVAEAFCILITTTDMGTRYKVVKYDLGDDCLSGFHLPPMVADSSQAPPALVTAEDGGLGLAHLDKLSLHIGAECTKIT
jgi:hypothetical protein